MDDTAELLTVRLPVGTSDAIFSVLRGGEVRAAFMRYAILAEVERRQRESNRLPSAGKTAASY